MAKVIFSAWKSKSQLLEVRSEFYPPPSYEGPDMRSHACAMVEAWKLRGNIPHYVEATALLTDAILHDDAQRNSIFSIRATYSAAFCRFVTGLVDSKIHGQRKTMFQRAVDLGLPASFVELRHEATHREPPSLVVLRKATQRSLEWLWDNYWAGADDLGDAPALEPDDTASVKSACRDVLQRFARGSGPGSGSAGPPSKKRKRDQEKSVAARLVSICDASSQGARILPAVLLEESYLVDPGRRLGESLESSSERWDAIFLKIAESHPSFVMYLSEQLVDTLVFDPANDSPEKAQAEALFFWLEHLLTLPTWEPHRSFCPRSYVLAACSENPNHWAKLLLERLREHQGSTSVVSGRKNQPSKKSAVHNGSTAVQSSVAENLREYGWGPVEKWDTRPLGIASTS